MGKLTLDAELRAKLNGLNEELEICDEAGRIVGHFVPAEIYQQLRYRQAEDRYPYTPAERQAHAHQAGGRSLQEIWKSLGRS
jgi:hypothetical protein